MRYVLLVIMLVSWPAAHLSAQTFEVGGSIGTSCRGSDGSFCRDESLFTVGPFAGLWFADKIEIGARLGWLQVGDVEGRGYGGLTPIEFQVTDGSRLSVQGEFVWHFRRGHRVRPMFGIGVGVFRDRRVATCTPEGCEPALALTTLGVGDQVEYTRDESVVVGVSVAINPRLRLRGGWRYHNPFYDEFAMSEMFLGVGYRLGRIRP